MTLRGLSMQSLTLRAGAGGRVLCSELSADVGAGERWVLLGPNGAGKSTLLATLAGLMKPAQGAVLLHGRDLAEWPLAELARERAWCAPHWSDPFPASVLETVGLARPRAAWWTGEAGDAALAQAMQALLARFDIGALAQTDVRRLSDGERQRVALAAAWWQGAPLLLLDEPASHLDLAHRQLLVQRLREHSQGGGSVVASLHDLDLAWQVATHAVLLDGRGGALAGPRDEVLRPERLSAVFEVPVAWVEACGERRFWVGERGAAA